MDSGVDVGLTDEIDLDLVTLSQESPWVGKPLDELLAQNHGSTSVLLRDGHATECEPSTRLEPGDRVLVFHPMEMVTDS
jgi:NhaP-type Na+/H+ and K+/H+ antiporter